MAKPKDHTSVVASNGNPSAMRRLSSLASLHSILAFSRSRRTTASTEDISIASDISTATTEDKESLNKPLDEVSQNVRSKQVQSSGKYLSRGRHETVSDDTSSKLPRSKTFSNLPIAAKTKETARTSAGNRSTTRAPASRIPSPTATTRRYLSFGNGRSRQLARSDTEPLLSLATKRDGVVFDKENVPLSFDNRLRLPAISPLDSSLFEDEAASTPSLGDAVLPAFTQAQLLRWKSQPSLLDDSQPFVSRSRPVRVPARPPRSPIRINTPALPSNDFTISEDVLASLKTPQAERRLDTLQEDPWHNEPSAKSTIRQVSEAQPAAYWGGRLSTMLDHARNNETKGHQPQMLTPRPETDRFHSKELSFALTRRALEELYRLCLTDEARTSFIKFQMQYAALTHEPAFARSVGSSKVQTMRARYADLAAASGAAIPSTARKTSFVERIMGRVKRSSLS